MSEEVKTAVVKKDYGKMDLRQLLQDDNIKSSFAQVLPSICKPERFARLALAIVNKTPKLMDCTKESVMQAFMTCAELGIETDGRRAHLIPYGDKCTLIIDYKGLVELAMRSGTISYIHADVICEGDMFEYNMGRILKHSFDIAKPRDFQKLQGAFCIIKFTDGNEKHEVMQRHELDAIRSRSKASKAGPWVSDYSEMCKKTVFRRASKWITLSPEVQDALSKEDDYIDVAPISFEKLEDTVKSTKDVKPELLDNETK